MNFGPKVPLLQIQSVNLNQDMDTQLLRMEYELWSKRVSFYQNLTVFQIYEQENIVDFKKRLSMAFLQKDEMFHSMQTIYRTTNDGNKKSSLRQKD